MITATVQIVQPVGVWRFLTPVDVLMPRDLICFPQADDLRDRFWEPIPSVDDPWGVVGKTLREARTEHIVAIRACGEGSTWAMAPQAVWFLDAEERDIFVEEYMFTYRKEHPQCL